MNMIGLSEICLYAIFTSVYAGLVVSVAWELKVKLSNQAGRILQANSTSSQARVLVLNLLQLLLSCGLVSSIKIGKTTPAPGRDYVLGCLLMLTVKLLHLKRETLIQDLVGVSSLAFTSFVCHQNLSGPASVLETASSFVNLILFCGPLPVIFAIVLVTTHLGLSTTLAILALLYIILQHGRSRLVTIPFFILLLQLSVKYQDLVIAQNNIRNSSKTQTFTGAAHLPSENIFLAPGGGKCENTRNDPGKYFKFKAPAFNETDKESVRTPSKVPEESLERRCSEYNNTSQRELTVLRTVEREGRCEVLALDLTGRAPLTKHLLHLLSLLLPSISLVPTVTISARGVLSPLLCSNLPGAQIISHLRNTSDLPCEEEIIFKQNSLSTQMLSFFINVKNSLLDQFL